jgi:hypothetical protein
MTQPCDNHIVGLDTVSVVHRVVVRRGIYASVGCTAWGGIYTSVGCPVWRWVCASEGCIAYQENCASEGFVV